MSEEVKVKSEKVWHNEIFPHLFAIPYYPLLCLVVETSVAEFYGKQDLPIFRNEQVKANEHLLTGAYIDVRDRNKAEFNAEMRSL